MQNDRAALNAIRTSNKDSRELLIKNSTKFTSKSNACNLKWRRLCNLSAIIRYNKHVWLSSEKLFDAYFVHERDLREAC